MITVNQLSFAYENSGEQVLTDLDLTIRTGEFLCVLGHSGCGKSTLIHLLAGLESAPAGSISRDGKAMTRPGCDRAVVFQQYSLFPWQTVRKNVIFSAQKTGRFTKEQACARADEFLKKTGLYEDRDKYPYQLSGGMRQRTAIARALAMDAETLLLDEPFGALDPQTRSACQQLLRGLWKESGKTVVFVTHDLDEALILGSRIVFLSGGRITREVELADRINCCCADDLGLPECRDLRADLEEWFHEK